MKRFCKEDETDRIVSDNAPKKSPEKEFIEINSEKIEWMLENGTQSGIKEINFAISIKRAVF